jgi:hypothetical protein
MALTELSNEAVVMNVLQVGCPPPRVLSMARWSASFLEMDQERDLAAVFRASHPLPLLDGFEILDDRADLIGLEDEFRHVWVAGRKALGQRLKPPPSPPKPLATKTAGVNKR